MFISLDMGYVLISVRVVVGLLCVTFSYSRITSSLIAPNSNHRRLNTGEKINPTVPERTSKSSDENKRTISASSQGAGDERAPN